ncbi:glycoside hydrolase family 5 protein [Sphingomonas sp. VNH70]|uniref:glycoside hydrolase family 5 protein n=1 Tax=Sphingomonas silueang TaxID=3156617 RepID=UPI0032B36A71
MRIRQAMVAAILLLCGLSGVAVAQQRLPTPELRRGINVLGYDPIWNDPAKARFRKRHFAEIRRAGFDFIRVNLQAFDHMDADGRLKDAWFKRVDWIVANARAAGLKVILDEHDFVPCGEDVARCRPRLREFWDQVAARYARQPGSVYFELLNEPNKQVDGPTWNALLAELLAVVRRTNPTRKVIIGPAMWNNLNELKNLRLPANDRNIVVTFHYYEPFRFTHQGAPWSDMKDVRGVSWLPEERSRIRADFAQVAAWARANDRPVLLGEFGAYDRGGAPLDMRVRYTDAVAREAEAAGFGWAYWQFDSDFIAWDMDRNRWNEPIVRALIPGRR